MYRAGFSDLENTEDISMGLYVPSAYIIEQFPKVVEVHFCGEHEQPG